MKRICLYISTKKIPHTNLSTYADSSTNIFVSAGIKRGADSFFFAKNKIIIKKNPPPPSAAAIVVVVAFVAAASQGAF